LPGWHSTIFPPYFVAGALYSGFAMVMTILIPMRKFYRLETYITKNHIDKMCFMMIVTGSMVGYGYIVEILLGFYSHDIFEKQIVMERLLGTYSPYYWLLLTLNIMIPQLLWFPKIRGNLILLFGLMLLVNVGMWLERFIIVVSSLTKSFMPSAVHTYHPTSWDIMTFVGTIGLFFALLFLFVRVLPLMAIFELKEQHMKAEELQ